MDFDLPGDDDPRRQKVRDWLAAHPNPSGRELAEGGYVAPHWPKPWGLDADPIEQLLIDFSGAMGGGYVPAPGWKGFFGDKKLTITHPLGGCRIGPSAAEGVVDEHGRVFDGGQPADSAATYPDLLVVDASVLPGAVVAHPTMTIVAQAIKTMDHALAAAP